MCDCFLNSIIDRESKKSLNAHLVTPTSPTYGGGSLSTGWRSHVAAKTWLRMLKILGNVNEIEDPQNHAAALTTLREIWSTLSNVRASNIEHVQHVKLNYSCLCYHDNPSLLTNI